MNSKITLASFTFDSVLRQAAKDFYNTQRKLGLSHQNALTGMVNFVLSQERERLHSEALKNPDSEESKLAWTGTWD